MSYTQIDTTKSLRRTTWLTGFWILLLLLSGLWMTACTATPLDKRSTTPNTAEDYSLTRVTQHIVRYDCLGQIASDQVDTISDPKELVEIRPHESAGLVSANFRNLDTDSSPICVFGQTKFNINLSPTVCDMEVKEGLNEIVYAFSYCDQIEHTDIPGCRTEPEVRERGRLFIYVHYREELRETVLKYPSTEECR